MIVVFDTNIWISDLLLTSSVGSAVRFYLRGQKARIGLPEVVKLETELHLRKTLADHIDNVRTSHRHLLALFGRLMEVVLPTDKDVEALVSNVFTNVGVEIQQYPFTLESARASLIRAVRKIPPSDKSQQFKDGVLWEDCLKLLQAEPVILVSNDTDFYKNRDLQAGLLAEGLAADLTSAPHEFRIYPSLRAFLPQIATEVMIDPVTLLDAFMKVRGDAVRRVAGKHSFTIEGEPKVELDVFATERPSHLYVTFEIELPCTDATAEGRIRAKTLIRGNGAYDAERKEFTELVSQEEQLSYQLPDGAEKKLATILSLGTAFIGHRIVEYSVRHKL